MVQERSPRFMVGWKCQGASRCAAVMGGELHLLHRPALPVRQIFRLQPVEELQHPRRGPAGDRCTGWSDARPADPPARRFAGERRYRSVCAPWRFLARVFFLQADVLRQRPTAARPGSSKCRSFRLREFDGIAVLEIPAEFEAAAIADGAGPDEFAGHQGLVLGDMGDDLLERE